jgi:hypothetical protein
LKRLADYTIIQYFKLISNEKILLIQSLNIITFRNTLIAIIVTQKQKSKPKIFKRVGKQKTCKMKTYNKKQTEGLKIKTFTATGKNGSIQVKAYLKDNAVERIQEWDNTITEDQVTIYKGISSSHQTSVDEIVQLSQFEFAIKTKD